MAKSKLELVAREGKVNFILDIGGGSYVANVMSETEARKILAKEKAEITDIDRFKLKVGNILFEAEEVKSQADKQAVTESENNEVK